MRRPAPPLTVALLTYNRLHYLKESLHAIIDQSFGDFELLVLDNHSTDGTKEFILDIQDPRIRYIRNAPGSTVEFNCISAYHIASSQMVLVTHDDDIMERDMLSCQMRLYKNNPNMGLIWTQISNIDENGKQIDFPIVEQAERIIAPGEFITSFLKERLWPMPSGVMLKRNLLPEKYLEYHYFRTRIPPKNLRVNPLDLAGIADVLLPAGINAKHAIGYIGSPMLRRRLHLNQFTHSASLSRPGVHLYSGLKKIAKRIPNLQIEALHFDAFVARFEVQEDITTNEDEKVPASNRRKVKRISEQLQQNIDISPDSCLAGLPVLILDHLINPNKNLEWIFQLNADEHTIATQKLLNWLQKSAKSPESSIIDSLEYKRIILFGSAFISALLILDARKKGKKIIACIDSNINRHKKKILGVSIHPPAWLHDNAKDEDVIIITSERDHEKYITSIIQQNLQQHTKIEFWKNLIN
jgi:glycosyltransferase involved in cell wall biosynthesis